MQCTKPLYSTPELPYVLGYYRGKSIRLRISTITTSRPKPSQDKTCPSLAGLWPVPRLVEIERSVRALVGPS
jgi:hypothetical protein